jgi:hypothetical protein
LDNIIVTESARRSRRDANRVEESPNSIGQGAS